MELSPNTVINTLSNDQEDSVPSYLVEESMNLSTLLPSGTVEVMLLCPFLRVVVTKER